jgi:TusA-related sulfurtransferase
MPDLNSPTAALPADAELDCKGLLCPLPVYQAARAIARLHRGQVLRIECTDPGSLADFPHWPASVIRCSRQLSRTACRSFT